MSVSVPEGLKYGCTDQTIVLKIEGSPKYFIRKMANFAEACRLVQLMNIQEFDSYARATQTLHAFPILCFPESVLTYYTEKKFNYVSILPYAPGLTLGQIVDNYLTTNNISDPHIKLVFETVGRALAKFHNFFMDVDHKTIPHGDFSLDNVIYNNTRVHFVDCDGMIRNYYDRKYGVADLIDLLSKTIHYYLKNSKSKKSTKLLTLLSYHFLHGYFTELNREQRVIYWGLAVDTVKSLFDDPYRLIALKAMYKIILITPYYEAYR